MKKLINTSFIYFILAMISGVFFRHFTKAYNFTGYSALSVVHTHLLTLGTFLFLILASFSLNTNLLNTKFFNKFFILYNISLPLLIICMLASGIYTVLSKELPIFITALAGISHILIFLAMILLFLSLKSLKN